MLVLPSINMHENTLNDNTRMFCMLARLHAKHHTRAHMNDALSIHQLHHRLKRKEFPAIFTGK